MVDEDDSHLDDSFPYELAVRDGVARLRAPAYRWLSTGANGGLRRADAAYNVSVPDGWSRTDLDAYVDERLAAAGFGASGPALLTGVAMEHARAARLGVPAPASIGSADTGTADGGSGGDRDPDRESATVAALATAGVTNPAALFEADGTDRSGPAIDDSVPRMPPDGTVNVLLAVDRPLLPGALANLLAVAAEAKTATLLRETGFPGTTTDAAIVGCRSNGSVCETDEGEPNPGDHGDAVRFTGSATPIGAAARACVRDAVRASLASRYADEELPESVADAEHGVVTGGSPEVFEP